MKPMYKGIPFSPPTTIANSINDADTTIEVTDGSMLPDGPNYAVIGTDESGEVISYAVKAGNTLSGCTRGVEGTAQAWDSGTTIARNWTNKDYQNLIDNIEELERDKSEKPTGTEDNIMLFGAGGAFKDSNKKISDFISKVDGAKEDNLATFGAGGVVKDSGKKVSDFVAVESGKGLSTNDYTAQEKQEVAKVKDKADKVEGATGGDFAALDADGNLTDSGKKPSDFVEVAPGKGLSTNDYTNEDKAEVAKVKDKANKAVAVSASLTVEGWTGDAAPYTQAISAAGVTADASQVVEVGGAENLTAEQYEAMVAAQLWAKSKADGTVTVEAKGDKPTVALPVVVVIYG